MPASSAKDGHWLRAIVIRSRMVCVSAFEILKRSASFSRCDLDGVFLSPINVVQGSYRVVSSVDLSKNLLARRDRSASFLCPLNSPSSCRRIQSRHFLDDLGLRRI